MHVNPGHPAVSSAHTPVTPPGADTAPPRHLPTHRVTASRITTRTLSRQELRDLTSAIMTGQRLTPVTPVNGGPGECHANRMRMKAILEVMLKLLKPPLTSAGCAEQSSAAAKAVSHD